MVSAFDLGPKGELVVLESQPDHPAEVSLQAPSGLKRLTRINDEVLKGIKLGTVTRHVAKHADGTEIDYFLTRPPDAPAGTLPAILNIHGGPVSQHQNEFDFELQLYAANGYAVIAPNPRGSSGRGRDFARAIWADWGGKDHEDVMAAVDGAIALGAADPDRLGVGGWSYGGILTDWTIYRTTRFKAATSGAGLGQRARRLRHRPLPVGVRGGAGLPLEERGGLDEALEAVPGGGQDQDPDPLPLRRGGLERAPHPLGADVPGPAASRGAHRARGLSGREPLDQGSELPERPLRALPGLVRQIPEAGPEGPGSGGGGDLLPRSAPRPPRVPEDQRKTLEENLAKANAEYAKDPQNPENLIWVGRRLSSVGRFQEAIAVYSRGVAEFPEDVRFLRFRGHRYITVRRARQGHRRPLEGRRAHPREGPLGRARARRSPARSPPPPRTRSSSTSTTTSGLAHYLKGDYPAAEKAYRECLQASQPSPDNVTATTRWLYSTLRHLGKTEEAAKLVAPFAAKGSGSGYEDLLLLYKGERTADQVLRNATSDLAHPTLVYGVADWHLVNGRKEEALALLREVVRGPQWAAFGYAAAEAELSRQR